MSALEMYLVYCIYIYIEKLDRDKLYLSLKLGVFYEANSSHYENMLRFNIKSYLSGKHITNAQICIYKRNLYNFLKTNQKNSSCYIVLNIPKYMAFDFTLTFDYQVF